MPYLLHGRRHLTLLLVLGHGFPMLQHVLLPGLNETKLKEEKGNM